MADAVENASVDLQNVSDRAQSRSRAAGTAPSIPSQRMPWRSCARDDALAIDRPARGRGQAERTLPHLCDGRLSPAAGVTAGRRSAASCTATPRPSRAVPTSGSASSTTGLPSSSLCHRISPEGWPCSSRPPAPGHRRWRARDGGEVLRRPPRQRRRIDHDALLGVEQCRALVHVHRTDEGEAAVDHEGLRVQVTPSVRVLGWRSASRLRAASSRTAARRRRAVPCASVRSPSAPRVWSVEARELVSDLHRHAALRQRRPAPRGRPCSGTK